MRLLKLLCGIALVAAVATMWVERDRVVSAYTDDSDPIEFRLTGIDLATARTPTEPSPFVLVPSPDLRTTSVAPLRDTTPPVAKTQIGGGSAGFSGTVRGPNGPAAGATVQLERHTTAGIESTQTLTDEFGNWSATGLAGGRWRVRSYQPNLYTSGPAQVFFVANEERVVVDTTMTLPSLAPVIDLVGPAETIIGTSNTFAITVGVRRVDAEGRIVVTPAAGSQVSVIATNSSLTSADVVFTDGGGAARFAFTCQTIGTPTLSVAVTTAGVTTSSGVTLAPCLPAPPPPEPEVVETDPNGPETDSADAPGEATG